MAGHWLRRNCLLKDALEGMVNGKVVCGRRKYQMIDNFMINEEEKKLAGTLAKKELPAEGCSRRNGKRKGGSRHKKISVDRQHCDKWTV